MEKLVRGGTFLWVLGERDLDEVVERRAPLVPVLERGRFEARLGHEEEGAHRVKVEHGRLELGQLDGRDAAGPNVAELVVASLPLHRCHLNKRRVVKEVKMKDFLIVWWLFSIV